MHRKLDGQNKHEEAPMLDTVTTVIGPMHTRTFAVVLDADL
jgi:hypothetical protein